jgi:hypothetical protein
MRSGARSADTYRETEEARMQVARRNDFDEAPWDRLEPVAPARTPVPYRLVLVEWHDAWFDADQSEPDDVRADYLVRTLGFLVREGPRFLSIAHEVLPDDDGFRAVTHIPLAIVERITDLTPCAR